MFEEELFAAGPVSVKVAPYRSEARKSMASQEFQCVHLYEKSAESRNSDCVSAVFEQELFAAGSVSVKAAPYRSGARKSMASQEFEFAPIRKN